MVQTELYLYSGHLITVFPMDQGINGLPTNRYGKGHFASRMHAAYLFIEVEPKKICKYSTFINLKQ